MCSNCAQLERVLEDSRASEQELIRTIEGLHFQLERSARAEQAARAELTKHREDSPRAKEIKSVLEHYVRVMGKTKAYKVGSDTARWKSVEKGLRLGYTAEELKEAVDGMCAMPFTGPHGRQSVPGERHDDITICLRDETYVDRFRGYARAARQAAIEAEAEAAAALIDEGLRQVAAELKVAIEDPIDRVLRALEAKGVKWRSSRWGDEDFNVNLWHSSCPACSGSLQVTVCERNHAHPVCGSCDEARVLSVLGLEPEDLSRRFVPRPVLSVVPDLPSALFEMAA